MSFKLPFYTSSQSTKASESCTNCNDLEPDHYSSGSTHYTRFNCSPDELHQAVSKGCAICSFVQAAIDEILKTEGQSNIRDLAVSIATVPNWSISSLIKQVRKNENADRSVFMATTSSMDIHLSFSDNEHNARTYDVILQSGSQQLPWIQLCNAMPTTHFGNTGSRTAAEWVQARIKQCHASHPACRAIDQPRSSTKPLLPKYIIEILGDQSVRLKEPINERADYACLSHFTKGAKSFIKDSATLQQYLNELPWNDLSKTFQDAITFLRYLGIRYIWIDTLCNGQDLGQDLIQHSGNMGVIYLSSYITLAATCAANDSAGLFTSSHEIQLDFENTQLLISQRPDHAHPGEVTDDTFPLLTRAWVAQEMLLSPRVLHFCNGELVFECMYGPICSCCTTENLSQSDYGNKHPIWATETPQSSSLEKVRSFLGIKPGLKESATLGQCPPEEEHFTEWRLMLMKYANLELTFERDRLPAISGLAQFFSNKFKVTYAAGIWVENLRNDLLWLMPHRLKPERRRVDAGAPTWSWANCGSDTTTYMCSPGSHLYFTVVAVDCVPLSERDPFGQLKSATLILQGPLLPLVLKPSKKGYDATSDGRGGIEVQPDLNLGPIRVDANERGLFVGLPIVREHIETYGLVLHRQDDGRYERVGLWTCSSKEGYYQRFDPPEWWRAEALHDAFETMHVETVVIV